MRFRVIVLIASLLASLGLLATAFGSSGEYDTTLSLGGKCLQGTYPISVTLPGGVEAGTVALDLAADGKITGTLNLDGRMLPITGKYVGRSGVHKLRLRGGTGSQRMRFRLTLSGDTFAGKLRDKGWLERGKWDATVDAQTAPEITSTIHVETTDRRRRGWSNTGTATACGRMFTLAGWVRGTRKPTLKSKADGFSLKTKGRIEGDTYELTWWRCKTYGVVVKKRSGTMAFEADPPDVALITVSGHPVPPDPAEPYVGYELGPALVRRIEKLGLRVIERDFRDALGNAGGNGYLGLVAELRWIRDNWVLGQDTPTRVVMVTHSHGGVRGHGAIRAVPDLPIEALIDLDANSCLWTVAGHETDELGGNPESAYDIGGNSYDLEDVVFDNVVFALEVRTPDKCGLVIEPYDDADSIRLDGTRRGIELYETDDSHTEVDELDGDTYPVVRAWLVDVLTGAM